MGNASGWANEALLRKGVGGSSAVVGVSGEFRAVYERLRWLPIARLTSLLTPALLNTSKRRTVVILLLAWSFHLVVLHVVDPLLI